MTWHKILHRPNVDLPTVSGIDITFYKHIWEYRGNKKEVFFSFFHNRFLTHYSSVDFQELGRHLYKKLLSVERIKKSYEEGKVLLKSAEREKTYEAFLKQFEVINENFSIVPWIYIEAWQNDFEKIIMELIERRKLHDKEEEILYTIFNPWKKTALLEIKDDVKNGMSIKDAVKKYQFLSGWTVIWYKPITEHWINSIVKDGSVEDPSMTFDEALKLLNPDEEQRKFIELVPYVVFFKDYRDDVRRKFSLLWRPFFENLAKGWNIMHDDLGYMTLDEIGIAIKTGLDKKIIETRKIHPTIVTITDDKLEITTTNNIEKYKPLMEEAEVETTNIIKGLTAQSGVVRGTAKIVSSYHDLKHIEKGNIMIANTTHPNYLAAMRKAAAIVTNEGGLICHAAIISREMKIPCIVGTKNATKAFKTGDKVEVDADSGVVRKL